MPPSESKAIKTASHLGTYSAKMGVREGPYSHRRLWVKKLKGGQERGVNKPLQDFRWASRGSGPAGVWVLRGRAVQAGGMAGLPERPSASSLRPGGQVLSATGWGKRGSRSLSDWGVRDPCGHTGSLLPARLLDAVGLVQWGGGTLQAQIGDSEAEGTGRDNQPCSHHLRLLSGDGCCAPRQGT